MFMGLIGGLIMYWWGCEFCSKYINKVLWHLNVSFKYQTSSANTSTILHTNSNKCSVCFKLKNIFSTLIGWVDKTQVQTEDRQMQEQTTLNFEKLD